MNRVIAAATLLCIAVLHVDARAGSARPLGERVLVRFEGECIHSSLLVQRIAFWLQGETLDDDISIEIRGQDQPRFELSFSIYLRGGLLALRRFDELRGPCADRVDALALSIATTVDPSGVVRGQTAIPKSTVSVADSRPLQRAPAAIQLAAGTWVSQVPVPEGTIAGEMNATWRAYPRTTFALGLLGTLPSDVAVGSGRARLSSFATRFEGCAWDSRSLQRLRGALCASVVGGLLWSRSEAFSATAGKRSPWLIAEPSVLGEFALMKRMHAFVALGLPIALRRTSLDVTNADGRVVATNRSPSWGFSAATGIAVVWP